MCEYAYGSCACLGFLDTYGLYCVRAHLTYQVYVVLCLPQSPYKMVTECGPDGQQGSERARTCEPLCGIAESCKHLDPAERPSLATVIQRLKANMDNNASGLTLPSTLGNTSRIARRRDEADKNSTAVSQAFLLGETLRPNTVYRFELGRPDTIRTAAPAETHDGGYGGFDPGSGPRVDDSFGVPNSGTGSTARGSMPVDTENRKSAHTLPKRSSSALAQYMSGSGFFGGEYSLNPITRLYVHSKTRRRFYRHNRARFGDVYLTVSVLVIFVYVLKGVVYSLSHTLENAATQTQYINNNLWCGAMSLVSVIFPLLSRLERSHRYFEVIVFVHLVTILILENIYGTALMNSSVNHVHPNLTLPAFGILPDWTNPDIWKYIANKSSVAKELNLSLLEMFEGTVSTSVSVFLLMVILGTPFAAVLTFNAIFVIVNVYSYSADQQALCTIIENYDRRLTVVNAGIIPIGNCTGTTSPAAGFKMLLLTVYIEMNLIFAAAVWLSTRFKQKYFQLNECLVEQNEAIAQNVKQTKSELRHEQTTVREKAVLHEHLNGMLHSSFIPPAELLLEAQPMGSGTSGKVTRAWYKGTQVVVKTLHHQALSDQAKIKRFRDEIVFQMHLRHPHIVQIIGTSWSYAFIGIVMEYMHRGMLAPIINDNIVPLDWFGGLGSGIALDVALGMAYLHQRKICHHDLKSDNLLVTEYWRCKLGDFGECRSEERASLAKSTNATPLWAAPEVLRCEAHTKMVDVWSYGIVLVEIVNRAWPYAEESVAFRSLSNLLGAIANRGMRPRLVRPCPSEVSNMIGHCLQEDPQHRPQFDQIVQMAGAVHAARQVPVGAMPPTGGFWGAGSVRSMPGYDCNARNSMPHRITTQPATPPSSHTHLTGNQAGRQVYGQQQHFESKHESAFQTPTNAPPQQEPGRHAEHAIEGLADGANIVYVSDEGCRIAHGLYRGQEVAVKYFPDWAGFNDAQSILITVQGHPNVLSLIDVVQTSQAILTYWCEWGTLTDIIHGDEQRGSVLDIEQKHRMMAEAASALLHCHGRGVIHRDFRPDNIYVDSKMKSFVAGFGAATIEHEYRRMTLAGVAVYAAPELITGKAVSDTLCVWQACCVLHDCVYCVTQYLTPLLLLCFKCSSAATTV